MDIYQLFDITQFPLHDTKIDILTHRASRVNVKIRWMPDVLDCMPLLYPLAMILYSCHWFIKQCKHFSNSADIGDNDCFQWYNAVDNNVIDTLSHSAYFHQVVKFHEIENVQQTIIMHILKLHQWWWDDDFVLHMISNYTFSELWHV